MADPNLILTLKATTPRAQKVFGWPHNRLRFVPPASDELVANTYSREATPSTQAGDQESADYAAQIRWTLDQELKDVRRGLVCGSDPGRCDVQLGIKGGKVSREHFRIMFDDQARLVLTDKSKRGTIVSYDGQAAHEIRNDFSWILFEEFTIRVEIDKSLVFEIKIADHSACAGVFPQRFREFIAPINRLNIQSQATTVAPSRPIPPGQPPIYINRKQIGRGEFATVYEAVDVSTGYTYAAKQLIDQKSQERWKTEVEITRRISHVRSIVLSRRATY